MSIVKRAWKELNMIICPGSQEGYEAMKASIEAGPPIEPSCATMEEMLDAVIDQRKITMYPGKEYAEEISMWDSIINGAAFSGEISKDDENYIRTTYPKFMEWAGEVFPA